VLFLVPIKLLDPELAHPNPPQHHNIPAPETRPIQNFPPNPNPNPNPSASPQPHRNARSLLPDHFRDTPVPSLEPILNFFGIEVAGL
jgi:hypothetical protein